MTWRDDTYVRGLLDGREKWGTVLSLSAVAGVLVFLSDHPHQSWLDAAPLVVGLLGTVYVLAVNCYYEQAEAFANADGSEAQRAVKRRAWYKFAHKIGFLGLFNASAPLILGFLATMALRDGLMPRVPCTL